MTHTSEITAEGKEQHPSRPLDLNVSNAEVAMRRRIGEVESANGEGVAERRKARVLRKKFGEGMVHEMPSVFNNKL